MRGSPRLSGAVLGAAARLLYAPGCRRQPVALGYFRRAKTKPASVTIMQIIKTNCVVVIVIILSGIKTASRIRHAPSRRPGRAFCSRICTPGRLLSAAFGAWVAGAAVQRPQGPRRSAPGSVSGVVAASCSGSTRGGSAVAVPASPGWGALSCLACCGRRARSWPAVRVAGDFGVSVSACPASRFCRIPTHLPVVGVWLLLNYRGRRAPKSYAVAQPCGASLRGIRSPVRLAGSGHWPQRVGRPGVRLLAGRPGLSSAGPPPSTRAGFRLFCAGVPCGRARLRGAAHPGGLCRCYSCGVWQLPPLAPPCGGGIFSEDGQICRGRPRCFACPLRGRKREGRPAWARCAEKAPPGSFFRRGWRDDP